MASHVQLNAANIGKTTWLFGQMLIANPLAAQEAAVTCCEHLKRTREAMHTNYPF